MLTLRPPRREEENRDGMVDTDQEVNQAGEEEEGRYTEKGGRASTTIGRPNRSTPPAKKARIRAQL